MSTIRTDNRGSVTHVWLARPESRNALSVAMMTELTETLRSLPADCRVVVLGGDGPAFSAGHDMSEMVGADEETHRRIFDTCVRMMETVQDIPQPVIARVHGVATAAGCQLVASCDLAVAADNAWLGTPGVKIGLFCSTPMVPVVRAVGRKRAMEMLLTAEPIDAATAVEWGLINRAVPAERLDAEIETLVDSITGFSPDVIAIGKSAFYRQVDAPQDEAYDITSRIMAANAGHPHAQEGMAAFLEKRKPRWR